MGGEAWTGSLGPRPASAGWSSRPPRSLASSNRSSGSKRSSTAPWAKLADARPSTLRLAPPKGRLDELAADYVSMRPMLFGSYPSIDEIVAYMVELEETINGLS